MFVFKKGKLTHDVTSLKNGNKVYRLRHLTSNMVIEVEYKPNRAIGVNSNTQDIGFETTDAVYKVYKDDNGDFSRYKEFTLKKDGLIIELFKEAIEYFETCIFEELKETPPSENSPPPDDEEPEDDTPDDDEDDEEKDDSVDLKVGDIIKSKGKYARILDIDDDNKLKLKELDNKEAMKILRQQRNNLLAQTVGSSQNTETGASTSTPISGSGVSTFTSSGQTATGLDEAINSIEGMGLDSFLNQMSNNPSTTIT